MAIYTSVTGEGKDIVLIHGWGGDSSFMQPLASHLAAYFRVTNIDLPGSGKSDWVNSINDIDGFADAIFPELPEKAIYIVWSFGGLVALSIASRFPEKVERMIGLAATPRFVEDDNWPGLPKPGFVAGVETIPEVGYVNFLKAFYDEEYKEFADKPASYHKLVAALEDWKNYDVLLKGTHICDQADFRDALNQLQCPIDLILGEEDGAIPKATYPLIKALNENIQLHVIAGGKHMPFWTHQEEVYSIIDHLLNIGG